VDAQVASIVALLEPVSGVLIGMLLYGEVPTLLGGLGILMILTSIVLISN
jgi:drug/metabolite transporter (DMT)-like permease